MIGEGRFGTKASSRMVGEYRLNTKFLAFLTGLAEGLGSAARLLLGIGGLRKA